MAERKISKIMAVVINAVTTEMADKGMVHKDLAERLGVSEQRVSQILSGRYNVTVKTLSRIAEALDLKLKIELHG